ncbi:MAG: GNAT family N-acetyltransferase [Paracoccaceae bacterium]
MADRILRRATLLDESGIVRCIERAYAIYERAVPDLPEVSQGIDRDIADNIVWVAELNGQITGVLVLIPEPDGLTIANVAVDPANKGQGIGGYLMERATAEAVRLGERSLRLSTHVDMPDNVALYMHLGWEEIGREGNKVYMSKEVNAQVP